MCAARVYVDCSFSKHRYGYMLVSMSTEFEDDFVGCLAGNLRAAARLATRRYDAELRGFGLRITQVAILATVRRHQPLSISTLALELSSERSVVARDIAVLARDGLLQVEIDPNDRRARTVTLTKLGHARLRAVAPAWRQAQVSMRKVLGPNLSEQALATSRAIVAALEDQ